MCKEIVTRLGFQKGRLEKSSNALQQGYLEAVLSISTSAFGSVDSSCKRYWVMMGYHQLLEQKENIVKIQLTPLWPRTRFVFVSMSATFSDESNRCLEV